MKIAIASTGKDIESEISDVAGRAPYYLIFENKELVETVENPFTRGGGGAGLGVAEMLANKEVDLVVAGNFGRNMERSLEESGVDFKIGSGSIKEFWKEE